MADIPRTPNDENRHVYCDPGANRLAVALFERRTLLLVCFCPALQPSSWLNVSFFGVEKPQIYKDTPTAQANDCIDVWGAACFLRAEVRRSCPGVIERVMYPAEWKGQLEKAIHHARLWDHLTRAEQALFPDDTEMRIQKGVQTGKYSGEVHNLLDACGIGLFCEGRTGRGGVHIRL